MNSNIFSNLGFIFLSVCSVLLCIMYVKLAKKWRNKVKTKHLSERHSRVLKHVHYFGLFYCITMFFIYYNFDTGFRGIWTSRIVLFFTLLSSFILKFILAPSVLHKFENKYFTFTSYIPAGLLGLNAIPVSGLLLIWGYSAPLFNPYDKIIFEDKKIRIESKYSGFMGMREHQYWTKYQIFEKRTDLENIFIPFTIDSVAVRYQSDSTKLYFYSTEHINHLCRIDTTVVSIPVL